MAEKRRLLKGPAFNPYNPFVPVSDSDMFFGFEDEINETATGLSSIQGVSFALIGGRRMGKTSFLLELKRFMLKGPPKSMTWVPVYINFQEFAPRTRVQFYSFLARKTLESARAVMKYDGSMAYDKLKSCDEHVAFGTFTQFLVSILENLRKEHGFVRLVFLIDEVVVITKRKWITDVFENLRFLLGNHPIRQSLGLIISAQIQLYRLLEERGSPLRNILSTVFLRVLDPCESESLITTPPSRLLFGRGAVNEILNFTGGHPHLTQYVMWRMCQKSENLKVLKSRIRGIANEYLEKQFEQFWDWLRYLNGEDKQVLNLLLRTEEALPEKLISSKFPSIDVHRSIRVLQFMGIISKTKRGYRIAGEIMRIGLQRALTGTKEQLMPSQKKTSEDLEQTKREKPTIGIITALAKEYAATKVMLEDPRACMVRGRGAGQRYLLGHVSAIGGGKHSVVLSLADKGNNVAATRATLLLEHFPNVKSIIMVGIAGGIPNPKDPDEHVRLGDVVVSSEKGIIQYDFVKEEIMKITHTPPPRPPSAGLLHAVRLLEAAEIEGNRPWLKHADQAMQQLQVTRPSKETDILVCSTNTEKQIAHPEDSKRIEGQPRIFIGSIASANNVLKNPVKRDELGRKFGVKAVEMEGSGIADAAWNRDVGYLVVRGICDYCDESKGNEWQKYAAIVAAAYTRALLESVP